jgi:hypothetical protein
MEFLLSPCCAGEKRIIQNEGETIIDYFLTIFLYEKKQWYELEQRGPIINSLLMGEKVALRKKGEGE